MDFLNVELIMKLLYLSEGEAIKFKEWKEVVKNHKKLG